MTAFLNDLKNILLEEKKIFNEIYKLEEEKSDAIIGKDGSLLQKISNTQEEQLAGIMPLEKKRNEIVDHFQKIRGLDDSHFVTLTDFTAFGEGQCDGLVELGKDLSSTLQKMKLLQQTNQKLMNDNMEFFNIMVEQLKGSVTTKTGYSEDGTVKSEVSESLLLNKTI